MMRPHGGVSAIPWLASDQIVAPLPPVEWLVEQLDMAPGAPVIVAGYGYSGKTISAQSLALSVATDAPLWGHWGVRHGSVRHLDYEQGARLTCERYQRLLHGLDGTEAQLAGLSLASHPPFYLDGPAAEETLLRACEDHVLLIVDSLRAAAPTIDENSSEIRRPLDMLARVSERTGCVALVIHHARKPSSHDSGGAKMGIRGSGAIFDAASSVLVLSGKKGEPPTAKHEKARNSGTLADDFKLNIKDVGRDGDERWGLRVVAEFAQNVENHQLKGLFTNVLKCIREQPGCSSRKVRESVRGSNQLIGSALDELEKRGVIRNDGSGRSSKWVLAESKVAP